MAHHLKRGWSWGALWINGLMGNFNIVNNIVSKQSFKTLTWIRLTTVVIFQLGMCVFVCVWDCRVGMTCIVGVSVCEYWTWQYAFFTFFLFFFFSNNQTSPPDITLSLVLLCSNYSFITRHLVDLIFFAVNLYAYEGHRVGWTRPLQEFRSTWNTKKMNAFEEKSCQVFLFCLV